MNIPKWKKFELLVAKVQQDLSPQATVTVDDKIIGKITGIKRQVDVSIRQKIGQYELLVAIDCKDLSVPVDVKDVEEVIGLIKDIGANKGVIVSASGFTDSAKKRGESEGLTLYRLIDTGDHDWRADISIPVLCDLRHIKRFRFRFSSTGRVIFPEGDPLDLEVYDETNKHIGKLIAIFTKKWNNTELPTEPGEYTNVDFIGVPTRITYNNEFFDVKITATIAIEKNLYFSYLPLFDISGFIDEKNGGLVTRGFETTDIDMTRIEKDWHKVASEDDLTVKPIFVLRSFACYETTGLVDLDK